MALTLIVEDGSVVSGANSYVSLAEANDYNAANPSASAWAAADEAAKTAALIQATRLLDTLVSWQGAKLNKDDPLAWPRSGVVDREGFYIDFNAVPAAVRHGTAELARHLIAGDRTADAETAGIKSMTVDTLSFEFDKTDRPALLPGIVRHIIAPFADQVGGGGGLRSIQLVRT